MSSESQLSDKQLTVLIKNHDQLAFRELFVRYWDKLYTSAFRVLGDEAVCEDIIQDIFLNLLERSSKEDIDNLKAYLYQAVRYQVASHIKRIKFIGPRMEVVENHRRGNNVEEYISSSEVELQLDRSISSLPDRCREVYFLSRHENLSNKEIAVRLGISVFTVETHVKKALKSLRNTLDLI